MSVALAFDDRAVYNDIFVGCHMMMRNQSHTSLMPKCITEVFVEGLTSILGVLSLRLAAETILANQGARKVGRVITENVHKAFCIGRWNAEATITFRLNGERRIIQGSSQSDRPAI